MNEGSGVPGEGSELQFDKVEHATASASRTCPICQRLLGDEYFEVNGNVICSSCAKDISGGKGGAPFLRALVLGSGAALLGTLVWYLIAKLTDSEWGLVAIGVGFLVGLAVRRGSRVGGGWRYQALAMALTYFSITASHVPWVIEGLRQSEAEQEQKASGSASAGKAAEPPLAPASKAPEPPPTAGGLLVAWALVFAIAFASPFLAGADGIMGLVIIGIALYEAWKLNRRVLVNGPFRFAAAPLAP